MLLSTLVWLPTLGAAALLLLDRRDTRRLRQVALAVTTVTFLVSGLLWIGFDRARPGMQFVEQRAWIPGAGIGYHLGVDGISLLLVLLTTLLTPLCLLSAWTQITTRVKEFLVAMCLLETGMLGVFVALDLFLFFVFWEAMLIPMYLIIGVWGGPRRVYAAVKFILYTMAGLRAHAPGHPDPLLPAGRARRVVRLRRRDAAPHRPAASRCRSSSPSRSPSRSRCRWSRSTPGSPTRTSRRPRRAA